MRLLASTLFAALLFSSASEAMPVEVSNPVADFLRRLEEKGVIPIGFWSTLPRDESEVTAVLKQAQLKETSLNSWDQRRLENYLDEFDPERKRQGTKLHYEDSSFTLHGSVEYFTGGYYTDSITKSDSRRADAYAFGSFTPSLEATYGNKAYLTSNFTIGMERDRHARFPGDNYDPQNGLPYNIENKGLTQNDPYVSTFDGFRAVMGVGDAKLRLEAGQDWDQWGPGHWQHTTLSDHPYFWDSDSLKGDSVVGFNGTQYPGSYRRGYRYPGEGPPLPQIRFRVGSDHWEYVKIIAQRQGLWNDSSATLIAHRLSVHFGAFRLGATEMLDFGTTPVPWIAFLPGIPLKLAEHESGNEGNSALSVDAEWIWSGHGRLYGELYLDDFNGLPLDRWGDKFATVVGVSLQDPLGIASEVHMEYAMVDPWVYEHNLDNTAFQNYGSLLGSMLPPNSQAFFISAGFPLPDGMEGLLEWDFRQRDLKSPGSSIFDIHTSTDSDVMQFLAQDVETRNQLMLTINWSWNRFIQLKGGAGWLWAETFEGNPGENLSTPSLVAEVHLRY
jgi:hypothetical protein